METRSDLKIRTFVQGQGGSEFAAAGILAYFEGWKRGLAAGLMSVEVIDEQWSMEGESPTVTLTIRAVIDTANLDAQVQNLRESEAVIDGMQQMEVELAALRAELEALKKKKETLKATESGDTAKLSSIARKKQEAVDKMLAIDALNEAGADLHRGDPTGAISRLNNVIAENPDNAKAHLRHASLGPFSYGRK